VAPSYSWSLEPSVLIGVVAVGGLYLARFRRVRVARERHPPGYGRLALFAGGLLTVVVALVSPVDKLGEQLLVMHMLQHVLLLDVAPILLILGLTRVILRPVTRKVQAIEQRAGIFANPVFAALLYIAFMWFWHVPALYDAALRHSGVHALEHICFGFAGTLYWWHLLSPIRSRQRLRGLGPIAYMVGTKLGVGLLGVALAFDPHAIYAFYEHGPRFWGLSAVDDQSLAGLLMALEQSIVMGIALVWLFVKMLNETERDAQRAERYEIASAE
jgi:cytochrome c oxidase assembly factor CtaG